MRKWYTLYSRRNEDRYCRQSEKGSVLSMPVGTAVPEERCDGELRHQGRHAPQAERYSSPLQYSVEAATCCYWRERSRSSFSFRELSEYGELMRSKNMVERWRNSLTLMQFVSLLSGCGRPTR